jgi:hypothetical protein
VQAGGFTGFGNLGLYVDRRNEKLVWDRKDSGKFLRDGMARNGWLKPMVVELKINHLIYLKLL